MKKIHKIVLTGGPCGGKTTALSKISERLEALGYIVMIVPETATYIVKHGSVHFPSLDLEKVMKFEEVMLSLQLSTEEHFEKLAEVHEKPVVMILDRGTMDIAAYMEQEQWDAMLDDLKWNRVWLRDRYDAVIHLTTAADGVEEYYTLENNEARFESPEEARAIDKRIKQAWVGHPHLRVVTNADDFEWKINQAIKAICGVLGEPEPQEIERVFLVSAVTGDMTPFYLKSLLGQNYYGVVDIEQTYLLNDDGLESRVRKRGQNGHSIYTYCTKTRTKSKLKRMQKEQQISGKEYIRLLEKRDPERRTIKKRRYCFLYGGKYFELDQHDDGKLLLEIELENEKDYFEIPSYLDIIKEVTDDPQYSNYALAKMNQ